MKLLRSGRVVLRPGDFSISSTIESGLVSGLILCNDSLQ